MLFTNFGALVLALEPSPSWNLGNIFLSFPSIFRVTKNNGQKVGDGIKVVPKQCSRYWRIIQVPIVQFNSEGFFIVHPHINKTYNGQTLIIIVAMLDKLDNDK